MAAHGERKTIDSWQDQEIRIGESRDLSLGVSESYSGMTVQIPIHVRRAD